MNNIGDLLRPSLEQLVREIKAFNHAWKATSELFGKDSPLSTSTCDLKNLSHLHPTNSESEIFNYKDGVK